MGDGVRHVLSTGGDAGLQMAETQARQGMQTTRPPAALSISQAVWAFDMIREGRRLSKGQRRQRVSLGARCEGRTGS